MNETARQILVQHSIVVTQARLLVLAIFLQSKEALNLGIVENMVGAIINRATVYRILKVFSHAGLLLIVPSLDGTIRYLLHIHGHPKDCDSHIHFLCCKCGKINSVDSVSFPGLSIPDSYQVEEIEVFVKGVCADCH